MMYALLSNRVPKKYLPDAFYIAWFNQANHAEPRTTSEYPVVVHEFAFRSNDQMHMAVIQANIDQAYSNYVFTSLKEYINAYTGDRPLYEDEGFVTRFRVVEKSLETAYARFKNDDLLPSDLHDERYKDQPIQYYTKLDSVSS